MLRLRISQNSWNHPSKIVQVGTTDEKGYADGQATDVTGLKRFFTCIYANMQKRAEKCLCFCNL